MRTADSIIVMEQGKVVEEGTHEDLVLEGGIYASLVARQTSTESKASRDRRLVSKGADSVADVHRALAKQVLHYCCPPFYQHTLLSSPPNHQDIP